MVGRVLQWDFLAWKLIQRTTPKSAEGWLMSPSRSPPVGYGSLTPTDSSIEEALKRGNAWITVAWHVCLLCFEPLRVILMYYTTWESVVFIENAAVSIPVA